MVYDSIIIGTSPISAIEALYRNHRGEKVLLIDEKETFGGAWTAIKHNDLPDLEIGCHIWSIHKGAFEFLEKFLDLDLIPLSPQPKLLKSGKEIPYDWKMNAITAKRVITNLRTLNFGNFIEDAQSPAFRVSILPSKYLYPSNGATQLRDRLLDKLKQTNIDLKLGEHISNLKVESEQIILRNDKNEFRSKKVGLTSLSTLDSFEVNNQPYELSSRKVDYIHLHLIVKNGKAKDFSYIRFIDDETIHRISDITYQLKGSDYHKTENIVVLVGIFPEAYYSKEIQVLTDEVKQKLIDHGYLNNNCEVSSAYPNVFPSYYGNKDMLKLLEKQANGKIEVLHSTDLIFGVWKKLDQWKVLLDTNSN